MFFNFLGLALVLLANRSPGECSTSLGVDACTEISLVLPSTCSLFLDLFLQTPSLPEDPIEVQGFELVFFSYLFGEVGLFNPVVVLGFRLGLAFVFALRFGL